LAAAAVLDDAAIAEHVARVQAVGFTIVEDAAGAELTATLRDSLRSLADRLGVAPKRTAAEGIATKRMYNLLAKDPSLMAMPLHTNVLPVVERLLDRECLLSGMTSIDIGPGEVAQPAHGDDIVMSRHLQRPHAPMMVTSMWALTDFTAANGGTRYVPGSHLWSTVPRSSDEPRDDERSLEMAAGSVMIFHGSLWHGGGANTTADEWRLGVNVQYCPGFVRQQQNPYLGIPAELAATFPDRLLELLGYKLYKGIMGHVDGRSPGEVAFGERFAETAYRDAEERRSKQHGEAPQARAPANPRTGVGRAKRIGARASEDA
jgi:ectoine hydroxylase-related dioxygenase (phytanoyl-CoA dioxygenase family)